MRTVTAAMLSLLLSDAAYAADAPQPPSATDYEVVHGWPQVPDNTMLDKVSGVAVDSHGDVYVLMRGGREWPDSDELDTSAIPKPTVWVFDGKDGRLKARWGANAFAMPHLITIDANDHVWIADVALHQVFEFGLDGKPLLSVGERAVAGTDAGHFNRPTQVAVDKDGNFYVADGYRNARVVKFDPQGKFVRTWGEKGKGEGQLDLPHAIAITPDQRLLVVDRNNARLEVFDRDGKLLANWHGSPFCSLQAVTADADGRIYALDAGDPKPPGCTGAWLMSGDGTVRERIGRFGNYDGQVIDAHGIAIGPQGDVYIADFGGSRVIRYRRKH